MVVNRKHQQYSSSLITRERGEEKTRHLFECDEGLFFRLSGNLKGWVCKSQLSAVNQSEHSDVIDTDKTKHIIKLWLVLDTNVLVDIEHSSICICCFYLE